MYLYKEARMNKQRAKEKGKGKKRKMCKKWNERYKTKKEYKCKSVAKVYRDCIRNNDAQNELRTAKNIPKHSRTSQPKSTRLQVCWMKRIM